MMKSIRRAAVCILIICSILLLPSQKVEAFDLPQPFQYNGLMFELPLPDGVSGKYITAQSGPFQTLEFNSSFVQAANILLPTITTPPLSQVSEVSITEIEVSETPTPTPSPTKAPTPIPPAITNQTGSNTSTGGGLNAEVLFSMSNNYRSSHGLSSFQKDERVCSLASARAPEIGAEIAEGHMHSGKNSHNFPYWFTENIISMNSEEAAFNWWVNDPIHHDAIVGNYTHSCVACSGNSCVQEFTSFSPK